MEVVKEFIKNNSTRLFISVVFGWFVGLMVEMIAGIWIDGSVNGFVMLPIILGSAIAGYFILRNNNYDK